MKIRVRFAPSPTGQLHIGSARTALFNWLLARHSNGIFILRIEDTDRERSKLEHLDAVLQDMRWLGLDWDDGPYFQSQRLDIYQEYLQKLLSENQAYPCYCTPEELTAKRELAQAEKRTPGYDGSCRGLTEAQQKAFAVQGRKPVFRFRSPRGEVVKVEDMIRGNVEFAESLEDFVIMKSDGYPLYNFACVIDDHLMEITDVLRGEEHLSNTPRQLLIYQAFGWTPPRFGHLSIILDEQRKKLSKREGATYLSEFRNSGFLPEALLNFIALLGWAPKEDLELLPMEEIIRRFGLEGIGKSPAVFDLKKLEWMNGQYIKNLPKHELMQRLTPFLKSTGSFNEDSFEKLVELFQERIRTLQQFALDTAYFYTEDFPVDRDAQAALLVTSAISCIEELIPRLQTTPFEPDALEKTIRSFCEQKGIKAGDLIQPLRLLLTGKKVSPGMFQTMALLGKETTLARLAKGVQSLKKTV